jgi:hypothetical protein
MLKLKYIARFFTIAIMIAIAIAIPMDGEAQCSMCRAIAESSLEGGSEMGKGLNSGIMYLMGIPYILLVVLGVLLFRKPKFR